MVRCNSCSRDISAKANPCPHCGQPDPYTETDARLDTAIRKKVDREMGRETKFMLGGIVLGVLYGWSQGGGNEAVLGAVVGGFLGVGAAKVANWFS